MLQAPISDLKTKAEASSKTASDLPEYEPSSQSIGGIGRSRQSQPVQQRENFANLQKVYGNQAVLRMKGRSPAVNPVQGKVLQRKCACGNSAGSSGSCKECQSKQEGILQTKLQIGKVGDRYEQEADLVADMVMRMPDPKNQHQVETEKKISITHLQRRSTDVDQSSEVPEIVNEVLRLPGEPLDAETRTFMEPRFGQDFSQVRVHMDAKAAESAQAVNALAYTVGQDVVFGTGQFAPETKAGNQLLAHELTHVIQQRKSHLSQKLEIGSPNDPYEQEAELSSELISSHFPISSIMTPTNGNTIHLQRRVSPQIDTIRSNLTYGIFDWAVTDAEAHEVIMILKNLTEQDFADTIMAMESEGLVDRLIDNLSAEDALKEYATTQRIRPHLKRDIIPQIAIIRSNLTYGIFDWEITDAEAHEVIMILKNLNEQDFAETIITMAREGLVDRLFDNLSEEDVANEYATIQRIRNANVRNTRTEGATTVTMTGPCTLEQSHAIYDRVDTTKQWAKQAKEAVDAFISNPGAHAPTGILLDRHFFHQALQKPLTIPEQTTHARTIRSNLEKVEQQTNPYLNSCAASADPLCRSIALAYVDSQNRTIMFCSSYFESTNTHAQTYHLLHEFTHVYANVSDQGYGDERVFAYLDPQSAIDNADAYALFALDVMGTEGGAAKQRVIPTDIYENCSSTQREVLARSFAFAVRMITNALNAIGDPDYRTEMVLTHFKTNNRSELQRVIERYQKLDRAFGQTMSFKCEKTCQPGDSAYPIITGSALHVCPSFFASKTNEGYRDELLRLLIWQVLGLKITAQLNSSTYPSQTEDQAYDNAAAYLGYAIQETSNKGTQIIRPRP